MSANIDSLINTLKAETAANAVTPLYMGNILEALNEGLQEYVEETQTNQNIVSAKIVKIAQGITLQLTKGDGSIISVYFTAANATQAGIMSAEQYLTLDNLSLKSTGIDTANSNASAALSEAQNATQLAESAYILAETASGNAQSAITKAKTAEEAAVAAQQAAKNAESIANSLGIYPIVGITNTRYGEKSEIFSPTTQGFIYVADESRFLQVVADNSYPVDPDVEGGKSTAQRNLLLHTNSNLAGWLTATDNDSQSTPAITTKYIDIDIIGENTRLGKAIRCECLSETRDALGDNDHEYIAFPLRPDVIKAGEKYTVSFVCYTTNSNISLHFDVAIATIDNSGHLTDVVSTGNVTAGGNGTQLSATLTATVDGSEDGEQVLLLSVAGVAKNAWTHFCIFDLKLERGESVSDWCAAPEDAEPFKFEIPTDNIYNFKSSSLNRVRAMPSNIYRLANTSFQTTGLYSVVKLTDTTRRIEAFQTTPLFST